MVPSNSEHLVKVSHYYSSKGVYLVLYNVFMNVGKNIFKEILLLSHLKCNLGNKCNL